MKLFLLLTIFSIASFAQSFSMDAVNIGGDIKIFIQDITLNQSAYELKLKKILKEGINIKHKEFVHNGESYVINIFANQKVLEKEEITAESTVCKRNGLEEHLFQIKSEVSFSISIGVIEQGFLKNINVLEGIENIQYQKRINFRCRH